MANFSKETGDKGKKTGGMETCLDERKERKHEPHESRCPYPTILLTPLSGFSVFFPFLSLS